MQCLQDDFNRQIRSEWYSAPHLESDGLTSDFRRISINFVIPYELHIRKLLASLLDSLMT